MWNQLLRAVGGVTALARELEVHKRTVHGWFGGAVPSAPTRRMVARLARRYDLPPPWKF